MSSGPRAWGVLAGEGAGRRGKAPDSAGYVKDVRERLTHGTHIKPEFEYELISMLAKAELSAAPILPLLSIAFGAALLFWVPAASLALWLCVRLAVNAAALITCRRFVSATRSSLNVGSWRRRLMALDAVNAASWALLAPLVALSGELPALMVLCVAVVAVLAVRVTVASSVLAIFLAGTLPVSAAVAAVMLMQGGALPLALAGLVGVLQAAFLALAAGNGRNALAMVSVKAEKDALIAEVEEEKGVCDEARRNAESASVAKSRFLATMSHELRTPLNAILGFSEVMMAEVLGPMQNKSYKEYAGNIHQSGKHLLQLINEILDLSRIEAGRYELHEEAVRLSDIVEDCMRLLHLRAESKGLEVVLEFQKGLDLIWADERAMRQICLNLVSNALKFTPRGGRITILVRADEEGGQTLVVRDTGPGIPKDEIPRVMEAFGQGSLAHQTAEGGTGLGLTIVHNLVSLHGGQFELRSELRKGTEVIVKIPRNRVLVAVPPLQPLGQERHRQPHAGAWRERRSMAVAEARS
ncbi:MAG: HAMP domain-containing sensor histidine kinase [Hyphomicrobiaceae bacterium]|nr:HAMP domain-containing sensor histidine kinase [Hyphomicrobiaceae bacterium]